MTGLEIFFTLASTAVGIASSIMQSNAEADAAEAQARINEKNAEMADAEAAQMRKRADIDRANAISEQAASQRAALEEKKKAQRMASLQRAKFAASGIDLDGSAAYVVAETGAQGEYNAEMQLWQGDERARAEITNEIANRQQGVLRNMDADKYRMGAEADRQRARNIKKAGAISAIGQGISGIGGAIQSIPRSQSYGGTYKWG